MCMHQSSLCRRRTMQAFSMSNVAGLRSHLSEFKGFIRRKWLVRGDGGQREGGGLIRP